MKRFSVKFKTGGHLVKAIVVAKYILKASRMTEAVFPEMLDNVGNAASIRLLCCK